MFPFIDFLLATIAVVVIIICYVLLLAKFKQADESSESLEFSEFSEISKLLQETYEDLPVQRRTESLKKIKEERIKEYLDKRKRKSGGS